MPVVIDAFRGADAKDVPFRPVRFFRPTERDYAERFAQRLRSAGSSPVRVIRCAGRGLRIDVGEDERRADVPVDRERRRASRPAPSRDARPGGPAGPV